MSRTTRKPDPDFVVRLVGPGLRPWAVPMRSLTKTLNAVQRLIEGRDQEGFDEDLAQEEEQESQAVSPLHLIGVVSGSAQYKVASNTAAEAIETLHHMGRLVDDPDGVEWESEVLSPLADLSAVAKALRCTIEFRKPGRGGDVLATVTPESYARVADAAFVVGDSSVYGYLQRVGGAVRRHCGLYIPHQAKMVICPVVSEDLVRQLGQYVYRDIVVSGTVTWFRRSWRVRTIEVKSFEPPRAGSIAEALSDIYNAGGRVWDDIDDPDAAIAEMRGN